MVFGHNERDLPKARQLAGELGMTFTAKLSWDDKTSPVRDREYVRQLIGVASRDEYREKHGVDYMHGICHQLWDGPQINWDGKVLGCCRNFWGDFGANAFTDSLIDSINSEKIEYAREMLLGKKPAREDIVCATCNIYQGTRDTGLDGQGWLKQAVNHR